MSNANLPIVIDGIIYRLQARGGISRVFNETLPRLCEQDDGLRIALYHTRHLLQPLPDHPQIAPVQLRTLDRFLRPDNRVWGRWMPQISNLAATANIVYHARSDRRSIWHSTYYTLPPLWPGPKVVTVYDLCQERFPEFFIRRDDERVRQMKQHSIERADAVLCISESTRQAVADQYRVSPDRLRVIRLAGSATFRQLDSPIAAHAIEEPFILFVGARYHYKNFADLLDAYSRWGQRADIELVIVGSALTETEQRQLITLGIEDRVRVLTGVSDDLLCQFYNDALAFVYPSLCEGFGIPLLEAMACGCPLVASRIPSTEEVAGATPFYFEPEQPDSLLSALDSAVAAGTDSPQVKQGLVDVATYSWDETARQMLAVYRELV